MKKIALICNLLVCVGLLASCTSTGSSNTATTNTNTMAQPVHHHDYKGETK